MNELIKIKNEDFAVPNWIDDFGNYNKLPTPYQEITWHDFSFYFLHWNYNHKEYRQICDKEQILNLGASHIPIFNIFWFHDYAIGIMSPQNWHCASANEKLDNPLLKRNIIYETPIRYFLIGCDHNYVDLSAAQCKEFGINDRPAMCYHVYRCDKCEKIKSVDSSD